MNALFMVVALLVGVGGVAAAVGLARSAHATDPATEREPLDPSAGRDDWW